MKKLFAALALMLSLALCAAGAMGEINLTKKDLNMNRSLDKNVTNVAMIMQDGEKSDTILIASINSRTGRSVMACLDMDTVVNVPEIGEMPIADVYAQGGKKSKGFLVARTLNDLLDLNVGTYLTLDIERLPELVDQIGALNVYLNEEEAAIFGTWVGDNAMGSDRILEYVRLRLDSDYPEKSRSYDALMDLLKQGLRTAGAGDMMSLGKKLLDSMDTNLGVMAAVTMVSAFQGGDDRREVYLSGSAQQMRDAFHQEVYQ